MSDQTVKDSPLLVTERKADGATVLDLQGNVIMGGGSARLREAIRQAINRGENRIVLNFGGVKYLDSSGVGELVSGLVSLNRVGGQMKLVNLPAKAEEVLSLSSLFSIFEAYDDESDALRDF